MPDNLSDLQNYELLILSNVPATALSMRQMDVARTYVQDLGGGLVMLGGDQSFGLGGYYKTTIEEILPVRSDFEKEKEKPSLAMILVIDKSGSMGGEKIEMAKEAAKSAVELLGPNDKVGVVAFEGETFWVSELHPCSDKGFILDRVSTIDAGGGTVMYPAMEEAYQVLRGVAAKLKHVIILTDGISAPGDFEGITTSMAQDMITVTTVGVGTDADKNLLEEISRLGKGRYYEVEDPDCGAPDLCQGDGHGEQVGDQRATVHASSGSTDAGAFGDRSGIGAVSPGLCGYAAEADFGGDPGDRGWRSAVGLVEVRAWDDGRVHVRRQTPLVRGVGLLAGV